MKSGNTTQRSIMSMGKLPAKSQSLPCQRRQHGSTYFAETKNGSSNTTGSGSTGNQHVKNVIGKSTGSWQLASKCQTTTLFDNTTSNTTVKGNTKTLYWHVANHMSMQAANQISKFHLETLLQNVKWQCYWHLVTLR